MLSPLPSSPQDQEDKGRRHFHHTHQITIKLLLGEGWLSWSTAASLTPAADDDDDDDDNCVEMFPKKISILPEWKQNNGSHTLPTGRQTHVLSEIYYIIMTFILI